MSSPENNIRWAEAAAAGDLAFPSVEQESGYAFEENYPNAQINQYRRDVARWASQGFATLGDFVGVAQPGDVGVVNSNDGTSAPGEAEEQNDTLEPGSLRVSVDTTGALVVTLEGDTVAADMNIGFFERDDLTTGLFAPLPGLSAPVVPAEVKLVTNGDKLAVMADDGITLFQINSAGPLALPSSLATIWTYPHGATVFDICMDHESVYLVGAAGTLTGGDNPEVRRIKFDAGSGALVVTDEDWHFVHGASLFACDTDGQRLFVGGLTSGGTSIRALNAATGVGVPADPVTWTSTTTDAIAARSVRTDGAHVYSVENIAGTRTIIVRGAADGVIAQTRDVGFDDPTAHAALDQLHYYIGIEGNVVGYRKTDLALSIRHDHRGIGVANVYGLASDGDRLFMGGDQSDPFGPSQDSLKRIAIGDRARTFRRVDPSTERATVYRQFAAPQEGA